MHVNSALLWEFALTAVGMIEESDNVVMSTHMHIYTHYAKRVKATDPAL